MGALLQHIGETPDDQITTEAQGRSSVIKYSPDTPQLLCRLIDQPGDLAIKFCQRQALQPVLPAAVWTETAGRLARVLASRCNVDRRSHRLAGSAMR
jgi:hypothetical protein